MTPNTTDDDVVTGARFVIAHERLEVVHAMGKVLCAMIGSPDRTATRNDAARILDGQWTILPTDAVPAFKALLRHKLVTRVRPGKYRFAGSDDVLRCALHWVNWRLWPFGYRGFEAGGFAYRPDETPRCNPPLPLSECGTTPPPTRDGRPVPDPEWLRRVRDDLSDVADDFDIALCNDDPDQLRELIEELFDAIDDINTKLGDANNEPE